jgi:hypothetical protein
MSRGARSMPGGIGIIFIRRMIGGRFNKSFVWFKKEEKGGRDG